MSKPYAILTTDLHLTEKAEDQYRFDLFPWILKQWEDSSVQTVIITGDLTDRKDNHSGWFVNRIVSSLSSLTPRFRVLLLKGNHDFTDPSSPFFQFLGRIEHFQYFTKPESVTLRGRTKERRLLMLPNTKSPDEDWSGIYFKGFDAVFLHQTLKGAKAENGMELDGIATNRFKGYKAKFFSGDIHVPQTIGPVTYIGAPYHIHFGDSFEPRLLVADEQFNCEDAHFPAPRKHTVELRSPADLKGVKGLRNGDWIKVRLILPRAEFVDWPKHRDDVKQGCENLDLKLHGVELREFRRERLPTRDGSEKKPTRQGQDPEAALEAYCRAQGIDEATAAVGRELLKGGL